MKSSRFWPSLRPPEPVGEIQPARGDGLSWGGVGVSPQENTVSCLSVKPVTAELWLPSKDILLNLGLWTTWGGSDILQTDWCQPYFTGRATLPLQSSNSGPDGTGEGAQHRHLTPTANGSRCFGSGAQKSCFVTAAAVFVVKSFYLIMGMLDFHLKLQRSALVRLLDVILYVWTEAQAGGLVIAAFGSLCWLLALSVCLSSTNTD